MTAQTWTRRPLKSRQTAWAAELARCLVRWRVHPNHISVASVVVAAAAAFSLLRGWPLLAALLIQLRLLCNLLDGMVATEGGLRSATGEIYNDLPDRLSDAFILVAAGYAASWPSAAHEVGWVAALLAIMTAYVRLLGGASGLRQEFLGPMAKPHRMATMTAGCVLSIFDARALGLALIVVAAGSLITVVLRIRRIAQQLEGPAR